MFLIIQYIFSPCRKILLKFINNKVYFYIFLINSSLIYYKWIANFKVNIEIL